MVRVSVWVGLVVGLE